MVQLLGFQYLTISGVTKKKKSNNIFLLYFRLRERKRESVSGGVPRGRERQRDRESQAGSTLRAESNVGLNPTTL